MCTLIRSTLLTSTSNLVVNLSRLLISNTHNQSWHRRPLNDLHLEENKVFEQLKHFDSDNFGTLDDKQLVGTLKSEALQDDEDNYGRLEINRQRKHAMHYRRVLTELIHPSNSKPLLVEAFKLFDEMRYDDRKVPKPYHYTLLITGCAEHGYTKKAFELFEQMLRQKLRPTQALITSLFNACAECPFKDFGLEKAYSLRQWLIEIGIVYNTKNYHAMIKAFGKLGDMKTAFQIVDEMVSNKQTTTTETFNMLLIGCNSDQVSGFGQAIRILRRMRYHKVPRDEHTYNLLLRVTRNCGISEDDLKRSFNEWLKGENLKYFERKLPIKFITSKKFVKDDDKVEVKKEADPQDDINKHSEDGQLYNNTSDVNNNSNHNNLSFNLQNQDQSNKYPSDIQNAPNFLTTSALSLAGQVIDINYALVKNPVHRLAIIGGMNGIISLIQADKAKMSIKTFTLLLELIPENNEAEESLITELKKAQVKPDTGFFNILIKRRCQRKDLKSAKLMLIEMHKFNVKPDIATFGVLAIGCWNQKLAAQLIHDMDTAQLSINCIILTTMLTNACENRDFNYITYVLRQMEKRNIAPSKSSLEHIVFLKDRVNHLLLLQEKKKINLKGKYTDEKFLKSFRDFKFFFRGWSKSVAFEDDEHPWDQFKYQEREKGFEKINAFKKYMSEQIAQRKEIKEAKEKGIHINIEDVVHDV